jgi:hypothetical protein
MVILQHLSDYFAVPCFAPSTKAGLLDSEKADKMPRMFAGLRFCSWTSAVVACSLMLWTPVSTPWLHEHNGEYFHDHGSGLLHGHWEPASSDRPLLRSPRSGPEARYRDWIQLDKSLSVVASEIDIREEGRVDLQLNRLPLTRITSPWAHGPPWLADHSLRSPPA